MTHIPSDKFDELIYGFLAQCGTDADEDKKHPFGLEQTINFDELYLDAPCLEANIHFPVDWGLLLDAVRTLIKTTVDKVAQHARKHKDLLIVQGDETDFHPEEIKQIIARIDSILKQLPAAKKQAHERIIRERKVANEDKLLFTMASVPRTQRNSRPASIAVFLSTATKDALKQRVVLGFSKMCSWVIR